MNDAVARRRVALGLVALAAVAVYLNSVANGFAYDDVWVVQRRELLHSLGRLAELLVAEYWPESLGAGLYRPLTLLTFAMEWALWGGAAFGFHLGNVVLHATASVLVAMLLLRWFPWWAALAAGLVFAVHPVHTEAVANIVGRAELLTAVFVLGACLLYTKASERGRFRARDIGLIGGLYVLAMLSKEVGVVAPVLLLLLDLRSVDRESIDGIPAYARQRIPLFAVLAVLLVGYLAVRWAVLDTVMGVQPDRAFAPDDSFPTRLFTMARVWPRYFELLLFPTELSADYSPAVILPASGLTPVGAVGFGLLIATAVLAVAVRRRVPALTAAIAWTCVALLPVSNLLFAGQFVLAERTFYLPSVGVSIAAAAVLTRLPRRSRRWFGLALALWIVGFSTVTVRRNPIWRATHTVWDDVRRKHPESSKLVWNLGRQHLAQGDWPAAQRMFRRSLELWPHHAPYLMEYALELRRYGELEEAERVANEAIHLVPDHPDHHALLALVRWSRGDTAAALAAIERGRTVAGEDRVLYRVRADIEAAMGRYGAAVESQRQAIRLTDEPVDGRAWLRLARFQAAAGDTAGALRSLRRGREAEDAPGAALDSLERSLESRGR